ncbi:hypothetical protein [Vibrio sp. ES.051]|nr:hypothetical protein [Vibrio sp. ES.051]
MLDSLEKERQAMPHEDETESRTQTIFERQHNATRDDNVRDRIKPVLLAS